MLDISKLHTDMVAHICTFLHPIELVSFSLCSFQMYTIANSDQVWSVFCHKLDPTIRREHVDYVMKHSSILQRSFMPTVGDVRARNRGGVDASATTITTQRMKYYFKTGGYMAVKNLEFMLQKYWSLIPETVSHTSWVVNAINIYETRYLCIKILDFLETVTISQQPQAVPVSKTQARH